MLMNFKFYVKRFLLSLFLVLASTMLYAQKKADITGTVYDSDGTTPAVGCAVTIEGTPTGVITDINGKYKIRGGENQTLVFSSLGYKTQKILIGPKTRIDVTLEADSQEIEGVVVTALGIKRDEKALGYAVTKVDNDVLTSTVSSNWMNALSGKVAGLNFDQASTGPGGSMRVTLRGETSINMNGGTALFVVDGVPITSSSTSSTSESAYNSTDGAVDFGNAAGDINPEDIENVSVLKGPAATALYGSRAANGAIIITTKSGRTTKGIGVTFSSSVSFEKAGFWPDFQYEYGAGRFGGNPYSFYSVDGVSRNWSSYAFGDKFDGHLTYEWPSLNDDGTYTMMEWRPRNFFAGFFDTGVTWNNNISVSGNNGKGTSVRVSVTDVRNDWIVPNTGYKQQTFSISLSQQINKYIKLDAKVNYYRKDSDNLPMTGYGGSSIMYPLLWNTPNVDAQWFKADYKKWVREGGDLSKSTQHVSANGNNPYYTAYEQLNKLDRDRVFGNLAATINFTEELSLILRCGMDLNNDFRTQQKPKGAKTYINGMYKEQTVFDYEMNNDFLLRYTKKLNDFDLSASFGGNNMMQSYRSNTSLAESLVVDRDYRLSNSVDRPKVTSIRRQKSINSFYGLISASWRNMIFLDVTGRNDWSSTLAPGNNSYFYPSVSGSVILSDLLHIDTPMVNFLKVRASWANVGNDTSPYQLLNYYNNSSLHRRLQHADQQGELQPQTRKRRELGVRRRGPLLRQPSDVRRGVLQRDHHEPDHFGARRHHHRRLQYDRERGRNQQPRLGGIGPHTAREEQEHPLGHELHVVAQPQQGRGAGSESGFLDHRNRSPRRNPRRSGRIAGRPVRFGLREGPQGFLRHGRRRIDDRRIGLGHRRFGRLSRTGFGIREPRQHAGRLEGGLDELDLLQEFPPELLVLGAMGRAGLLLHQCHAGLSG